jgi:hypothetical protein
MGEKAWRAATLGQIGITQDPPFALCRVGHPEAENPEHQEKRT